MRSSARRALAASPGRQRDVLGDGEFAEHLAFLRRKADARRGRSRTAAARRGTAVERRSRPRAGLRKPMMVRKVVVLPAPLRPTRQTSSPARTSSEMPRRMRLPWISTTRSRIDEHQCSLRLPTTVAMMARVGEELFRRQVGQDLAFRQRDDAIGIGRDQVHVVLDQDERLDAAACARRRSACA